MPSSEDVESSPPRSSSVVLAAASRQKCWNRLSAVDTWASTCVIPADAHVKDTSLDISVLYTLPKQH